MLPRPARRCRRARRLAGAVLVAAAACAPPPRPPPSEPTPPPAIPEPVPPPATGRVEILWDTWGIPHVFAQDEVALLWGFGWAQMHSHGNLLLRLYGRARGRAAEYWGEAELDSDRWVHTNGIPGRAREWLARQDPLMRALLSAFADGINEYARVHPDRIADDVRIVLPVESADVLAHVQRVIHFGFVASPAGILGMAEAWESGDAPDPPPEPPASNGWAIAPARSESGRALLLANPHLPWSDYFTWYEAQLVAPGLDAYGAALVGFPLPGIAFNDRLGWTHTVNTHDGADLYELTLDGDGYLLDGRVRPFETQTVQLRVLPPGNPAGTETLTVRRSVHGPVVAQARGRALALRVAGLDRPDLLAQTRQMLRARNLAQFEDALARLQIPMFTVLYADRDGHILHLFNGQVPKRSGGDWATWAGIVPGDRSGNLWSDIHEYGDLPRVLDPPSGWLQNANDPPWTTTLPLPLRPERYPAYLAPVTRLAFRPQRSLRMLFEDERIAFDEMVEYKHSTRAEAADHILEDLIVAARDRGTDVARRAADALELWDRQTEPDSRGAVLFQEFFAEFARQRWASGSPFDQPWRPDAPLTTPDGLSDPAAAAAILESAAMRVLARHGRLDAAWGDAFRLRLDSLDLPANGGPGGLGIFRVVGFSRGPGGAQVATSGDSWVAAIEFDDPVRAAALLAYGNASQPGSTHRADQLPLFARKQLRPVWRTRARIEANLEARERY